FATCGLATCGFATWGFATCGLATCGFEMRGVLLVGSSGLKICGVCRSLVGSLTTSDGLLASPLNNTLAASPAGTIGPSGLLISTMSTRNGWVATVPFCPIANTFSVTVDSG